MDIFVTVIGVICAVVAWVAIIYGLEKRSMKAEKRQAMRDRSESGSSAPSRS